MPSPIAHSLTGFALASLLAPPALRRSPAWYGAALIAANAPDADFIAGLSIGYVNALHGGITHSLGAALAFSAFGAIVAGMVLGNRVRFGVAFLMIYLSHVVLDLLSGAPGVPNEMPVLWPFSSAELGLPWQLLPPIAHGAPHHGVDGFLQELFSAGNLRAVAYELAVFVPLSVVVVWSASMIRRRSRLAAAPPVGSQAGPGRERT